MLFRPGIAGHILDQTDDRHVGLLEQADRARGVDQRQILRGRDDDRAGGLMALDHGELYIAGARWQIDDERRSEEHTSELQSLMRISYAVFCLQQKIHYSDFI